MIPFSDIYTVLRHSSLLYRERFLQWRLPLYCIERTAMKSSPIQYKETTSMWVCSMLYTDTTSMMFSSMLYRGDLNAVFPQWGYPVQRRHQWSFPLYSIKTTSKRCSLYSIETTSMRTSSILNRDINEVFLYTVERLPQWGFTLFCVKIRPQGGFLQQRTEITSI